MGVGNAFGQYDVRGDTIQRLLLVGFVYHQYPLALQFGYLILGLLRYQYTLRDDQHLIGKRQIQQSVLVHRVVLVAVQGINPVLHIQDACRVPHTYGRFLHRLSDIGQTLVLRGNALRTEQSWQHGHQTVRCQCTAGHLLARIDGNVHYGLALLQQPLTAGDVVHKSLGLSEPRLVALEEESDAVERHTRFAVEPRVMGVDVEKQTVHAQGKVAVQQGFYHGGRLVPHTTHLRKAFGLNDVLAIDVCSADGIQHISRLVVSG